MGGAWLTVPKSSSLASLVITVTPSLTGRATDYSINVQIINTPDLRIIYYASGFVGSRHDSHCLAASALSKSHTRLLEDDEWCWADSGLRYRTGL